MRGYCTHWNVELDVASSGEEALTKIQSKTYDLIMMDIQMPGMDGYETTQRIRSLLDKYFQEVPILAVSASTPNGQNEKYKHLGMNGYILKPINPEKMYNKLAKIARKKIQETAKLNSRVFSQLDEIYGEEAEEYRRLLKVMKKQFKNDKEALIKVVMEKDDAAVSQIRHRSLAIMATLHQHDFIHFLNSLKVLNDKKEEEIQYIITHVNYQFDEILMLIKHKINTLRLQKEAV
jgi:CheY-like chemotaxis protein